MANTYLQRSTTTRTNNQAYTFSCWFKRGDLVGGRFCINYLDGNNRGYISIQNDNKIFCYDKVGGTEIDSRTSEFTLTDTNGWYHYVQSVNNLAGGSGGSLSDRFKTYLNGVDVSGNWTMGTSMAYNRNLGFQAVSGTNGFKIGSQESGSSDNWNGSMSHVHFVDGLQLPASTFGETDATTGEWKIKTSPTISEYGNNGFFVLKDGNSVTDQSGKGNNFTVAGGTLTKTEDNPSNVFATWNVLYKNNSTFSNGNTTSASGSSGEFNSASTLGMSAGKYYMEFKRVSGNYPIFGIVDDIALAEYSNANMGLGKTGTTKSIALRLNDGKTRVNNVVTTQGGSISNGDIVGVAVDKTTSKIYFSKNGQWSNGSGAWDSTTFNASTGATDVSSILTGDTWFFACGTDTGEASNTFSANFGNGYFGTTAVSSAGTNASGIGIFEYDVPTGFTALSTKGLNL